MNVEDETIQEQNKSWKSAPELEHFPDCCLWLNEHKQLNAKKYERQLGAMVDARKHNAQIIKTMQDQSRENDYYNSNNTNETFPLSSASKDQKKNIYFQDKFADKHKGGGGSVLQNFGQIECGRIGGCGEPLLREDGHKLTRRSNVVQAIQGPTSVDSYGSVNAAKEDKKAKFEYPLLEKEQMKKLLLQSDRVVFQNSSGFFHNEIAKGNNRATEKGKKMVREEFLNAINAQHLLRKEEEAFQKQPTGSITKLLDEGRVGRPERHPLTGVIIPQRKIFSDVTSQTLKQRHMRQPENYVEDLQKLAQERYHKNKENKRRQRDQDLEHISTFNNYFDRPGYGAPTSSGIFRRKFSDCGIRASLGKMGNAIFRPPSIFHTDDLDQTDLY